MALKKQKTLNNGATGEYWVAETREYFIRGTTEARLLLFKDQQTRTSGGEPLDKSYVLLIQGLHLTKQQIYDEVKKSRQIVIKEAVIDEEGNVVEAEEYGEGNWFADSVDI
jgi:hypothetical protein